LAGFDDIFSAELAVPALTTIRAPLDRIGAAAMEMLVDDKRNRVPTLLTLPTQLVIRESTAPPRSKN
jgi:LacI family transcriptional regulator